MLSRGEENEINKNDSAWQRFPVRLFVPTNYSSPAPPGEKLAQLHAMLDIICNLLAATFFSVSFQIDGK